MREVRPLPFASVTPTNVLLTCAGQRVDMVGAFRAALSEEGLGGIVVAADLNPLSPALYAADERVIALPVSHRDYIRSLLELCHEQAIRAVIPLTDLDQRLLGEARDAFAAAGATVIASDPEVSDRCGDKYAAARFFEANDIPSPRTWLPDDLPPAAEIPFPVLVKSRRGFGSRDIYRAADADELAFFLALHAGGLDGPGGVRRRGVLHRRPVRPRRPLPGRHPALDDRVQGRRVHQGPEPGRSRPHGLRRARGRGPARQGAGQRAVLPHRRGRHEVTDVNPRFGGAFPLPVAAGGRYPAMVLALARGERVEPRLGDYRAGVFMTRFFSHVALVQGEDGLEPFDGDPARPAEVTR